MTAKQIAKKLKSCFEKGNKVMICGNGGSAAESQHFAAELIHEGLPVISLTTDTSVLTSTANDDGVAYMFSNQVKAIGKAGDLLLTLSTSGNSVNVMYAQTVAKARGIEVIDFPRKGKTPQCQEYHLKLIHQIWQELK